GDRGLVLAAVAENGNALEFAEAMLRGDRDFVLEALRQTAAAAPAVAFVAEELLKDSSFVLEAVRMNPWTIGYLPADFQRHPEIVQEAVKRNGRRWNPLHPNCKASGRTTWARRYEGAA
ncbi:unnamed protein product, partial [Effrenium voratum]